MPIHHEVNISTDICTIKLAAERLRTLQYYLSASTETSTTRRACKGYKTLNTFTKLNGTCDKLSVPDFALEGLDTLGSCYKKHFHTHCKMPYLVTVERPKPWIVCFETNPKPL